MNIIEAVKEAESGYRICNEERKEWIELAGGIFRHCTTRSEAKIFIKDINSDRWISERDFIVTTKQAIREALKEFFENHKIPDILVKLLEKDDIYLDKFFEKLTSNHDQTKLLDLISKLGSAQTDAKQ
jgi:hypothetical protein